MQALPHVKIIKTSIKFHPAQSNSYFIVTFATDRYREIAKPGLGCTENKLHSGPSLFLIHQTKKKIQYKTPT